MIIEYIDHKISEEIKQTKHNNCVGNWIIELMIINDLFKKTTNLPIELNNDNITITKIILENTCELDRNILMKIYNKRVQ